MNIPEALGIVAGVFLISGYVPYILEVVKRKTIPNRASWLIVSISTALILVGVNATGTDEAIWVPVAYAVGSFAILVLSLFFGVSGWSRTDQMLFLVSAASVFVFFLTENMLIALLMNLAIFVSGYISIIKKVIVDPESESLVAWSLFFIGVVLNLVTVAIGTDTGVAVWLYPIVLVATVGTLYFFLLKSRFHTWAVGG